MRLDGHVEVAGDREQPFEHAPDADVLDRQSAHGLADRAQGGGELGDIVVRRDILRFEMDFGDALIIAGDEAVEDLGEPHPRAAVDAAHDAEVDRRDAAVLQGEQIALVKVGVEEAVDHRLAEEGADEDRGEVLAGRAPRRSGRRGC